MAQRMSNALRLEKEGKVVSGGTSGTGGGTSGAGSTVGIKGPDGTVKTINTSPKTINGGGTAGTASGGNRIEFSGGSTSGSNAARNAYMQAGARNAGVDTAALNKQSYTPEDAKTYANRETAYNFLDKNTGKINTIYSNYTNYKDAAREAGYDLADEGKTWRMDSATTYGIAGSSGRGTAYGASGGGYNSNNPASGGWYGEAMRRVNDAQNNYGGLDNITRNNDEAYRRYMQGNYLPIYGQDPDSINWADVASGAAAQAYRDAGMPAVEQQAYQQAYEPNSYYETLMSGLAYTPQELSYQAPSSGYADLIQPTAEGVTAPAAYNYIPVSAAQWNYDVPETVRMQSGYTVSPAAEAYSGLLETANTDADIAMAQYWADIAATAKSQLDRDYALRQALRYRNRIA